MKRGYAVVGVVLLVGYSLYGIPLAIGFATGGIQDVSPGTSTTDSPTNETATVNSTPFRFRPVAERTGFEYSYQTGLQGNQQMISNAGVFTADYNRDGWTDVLAIGGERPVLFENREGEFQRTGALPVFNHTVRSALFLDHDADDQLEILILANNRTPALLDWRQGEYVIADAGFDRRLDVPIGATTADYNGDGCSDVFVIQYGNWSTDLPTGLANYSAPYNGDNGNPNQLYYGNCSTFDRATDAGIRGNRWSLATSSADFDNDGDTDLHVANDFNYDTLYVNRGNGSFKQVRLGERTNRNGMSSEVSDVNDDGRLDIFVTNIYYPDFVAEQINDVLKVKANGNNLLINRNEGFDEKAKQLGVYKGGWGWAAVMSDFDNDGDEDLFHTTRKIDWERRSEEFFGRSGKELVVAGTYSYYSWPVIWSHEEDDFRSLSAADTGFEPANGRGVARFDYNRDGAIDLVVATTGSYRLYENVGETGTSVQFRIQDENGSRAVGARVYLTTNETTQWRSLRAFTDFLSQDAAVLHFGTADAETVSVRVVWPDGTTRFYEAVPTGQRHTIRPSGIVRSIPISQNATSTD